MQTISGFTAMHSLINEKEAVLPVPEEPVRIVILFVKSKLTIYEVWTVEKWFMTIGLLFIIPPFL